MVTIPGFSEKNNNNSQIFVTKMVNCDCARHKLCLTSTGRAYLVQKLITTFDMGANVCA